MAASLIGAGIVAGIAMSSGFHFSTHKFHPDSQGFQFVRKEQATSSTEFRRILPLSNLVAITHGPVTLTFSGDFDGAPVAIRARIDRRVLKPGAARFSPSGADTSRSFTFVGGGSRRGCHAFTIEWRSPTGAPVTLRYGDYVVSYASARPRDGQRCE